MTIYKNGPVAEVTAERANGKWEVTMRNAQGVALVTHGGNIERSYQTTQREAVRYARMLGRHYNVPVTVKL